MRFAIPDWLRTGPSELTIVTPDVIPAMFEGINNKFTRTDWFDAGGDKPTLTLIRDASLHAHRRRIWDQAFTAKGRYNRTAHVDGEILLILPSSSTQLRGPSGSICRPAWATDRTKRRPTRGCQSVLPVVQLRRHGSSGFLQGFQHDERCRMALCSQSASRWHGDTGCAVTGTLASNFGIFYTYP